MNTATDTPTDLDGLIARAAIDHLDPSPTNPRKRFDEAALAELKESIIAHGVMQPLLVRTTPAASTDELEHPRYEIVAGERRYRAAKAAGLTTLPVLVRSLTDAQVLEMQVVENLQRQDLHPLEEAEGYEALIKQHAYTAEDIAAKVGKSRAYVYGRLKLCALGADGRKAFYAGMITPSTALLFARISPEAEQKKALASVLSRHEKGEPVSHAIAVRVVHSNYMLTLKDAPFDVKATDLLPHAGSCADCPRRAGNAPELFADVKDGDTCTDPTCYQQKRSAHNNRQRAEAERKGYTVISGKEAKKLRPSTWSSLNGWTKYDDSIYINGKARRIATLLDAAAAGQTMLQDPHTGDIYRIVPDAAVAKAVRAAGGDRAATSSDDSAWAKQQAARKRKAKREMLSRRRIHEAIRAKCDGTLGALELRLLAIAAIDAVPPARLDELWGHKDRKDLYAAIDSMSATDLGRLLIDDLLVDETEVAEWNLERKTAGVLDALAARYDIDTQRIRADVDGELKAAEKPKAKPKKKAAKKAVKK